MFSRLCRNRLRWQSLIFGWTKYVTRTNTAILDFPKPEISKQLKSFLGLVNYFHNFIRSSLTMMYPLYKLLTNYNKTSKIVWTPEANDAFEIIKSETAKCTTMHFLSDTDPIFLHTDASDYGVGA
jgi:hypothetical protein